MSLTFSHPLLYQINARPWLQSIGDDLGRRASLDDVPDSELDALQEAGFEWIYLLGVWQTGELGRRAALEAEWLRDRLRALFGDSDENDICSSCFSIQEYRLNPLVGDEAALARFRLRLHARGMRLMLDFVPNHTAVDHPWAVSHPEYYIQGEAQALEQNPQFYTRLETAHGKKILAHGRDPYFPAWQDTLQLNYGNPELQQVMQAELLRVAAHCDGLRCDTAMLLLPGVIERIWGIKASPFWPDAIARVRREAPDFVFLAEVYWGLEWRLQQDGFDFTYDKGFYDRLRSLHARPVSEHLLADLGYQSRLARFLENHDEQRAAAEFTDNIHPAAAAICYLNPGMRFFHQGQLDGYQERLPVQLCRAPRWQARPAIRQLYSDVLRILREPALHSGSWRLLDVFPTALGDSSWEDMLAWAWDAVDGPGVLAIVNYSPQPGAGFLRHSGSGLHDGPRRFEGLFGDDPGFTIHSSELASPGLRVELPAWGVRVYRTYLRGQGRFTYTGADLGHSLT